ncbi:MAG: autoinducer binding domain-containing protein [Rhodospirillales bacterium]|nr:MAG: autoinducer binding domain-containing protein [Rhodospirillales bacterium]
MRVDDFIEISNRAETSPELISLFQTAVADYGYDNVIVAEVCGNDIIGLPVLVCPEGYPDYYFDSGFQEIDPVLPIAMTAKLPYHWNEIGKSIRLSKKQCDFFEGCNDAGVADGMTVPIHGPQRQTTVISLSCRERNADAARFTANVSLLAVQFDAARWRLMNPGRAMEQPIELTPRERECLRWCKAGKSAWDISQLLGISERTAQFHISNAMAKLGASSRIAAVVIAIQKGLLSL